MRETNVTACVEKYRGHCWELTRADLTAALVPILARMEIMVTRHQHEQSRDELLARYEGGVWTFLIVVGLALFGMVVWIGLLFL